jgi:hypothetical protein
MKVTTYISRTVEVLQVSIVHTPKIYTIIISDPDETGELIGTAEVIDVRNLAIGNRTFL